MLTRNDFKQLAVIDETEYGLMVIAQTVICKYGQAYSDIDRNGALDNFVNSYYPIYLSDFRNLEN